jgi:hypothetical protein
MTMTSEEYHHLADISTWVSWTLFLMLWKLITIALNDFNGLFGSLCFVLRFGDDETEDTYSSAALEELIKLKNDNQKSDFWIGGDFNLPPP